MAHPRANRAKGARRATPKVTSGAQRASAL